MVFRTVDTDGLVAAVTVVSADCSIEATIEASTEASAAAVTPIAPPNRSAKAPPG